MVILVILFNAEQHFVCVLNRRLLYGNRLEAAFKRGVLFNIFAVFVKGGCADDLNFPAGQRRLHNIGGIHRALGVARADQIVHLVDKQDNVALGFDLFNQALNTAFKLPAKLRARDQSGQIKQMDFFIGKFCGHRAFGNFLRQALGNRRFPDARFTN